MFILFTLLIPRDSFFFFVKKIVDVLTALNHRRIYRVFQMHFIPTFVWYFTLKIKMKYF